MDPQAVMATASVLNLVVTGLQVVVTAALALVVYRGTVRIARLEFAKSLRELWMNTDSIALQDPETLMTADGLLTPKEGGAGIDFARKRWYVLAYLNPISTTYDGIRSGIYGSHTENRMQDVRTQLRVLLRDEDAYWVTQHHGHEPSFRQLCTEIRGQLLDEVRRSRQPNEPAL